MFTCTTQGIEVSVTTRFEAEHSDVSQQKYIFSYRVSITNNSDATVQLLRRHWFIIDSNGSRRQVQGEGVVGQKPVLEPGESHEYRSWCPFNSEIGQMRGYFTMQRQYDHEYFDVRVPDFTMTATPRSN